MTIQKVAVIGSGVMGSGIAAQVANAGIPVVLLDIVPKTLAEGEDRSKIAKGAIEKLLKMDPAPFMSSKNAKLITPGNLEDDLKLLSDCDWVCEVVLEDLKIKHTTYENITPFLKKGAIVSSNTSTIPLEMLTEKLSKDLKKNFLITHFFNPPRYLRLLEIVTGKDNDFAKVKEVVDFCDVKLGKGVVKCKDTPGFIVNRILTFFMQTALNVAISDKVSIEVADAVLSKPVGIPKTGVFGLIDLVGVDLMPHLAESLLATLPKEDPYRKIYKDYEFIGGMIKAGYTGRKGKGGFYRLHPDGSKEKQALNLQVPVFGEDNYKKADKPKLGSMDAGKQGLRAVVTTDDEGGKYAWKVLRDTLVYAASLVPDIADSVAEVDEAMRLGTNWKSGPFEMIDALGTKWFADKLKSEGIAVPALLTKVGDGSFYKVVDGKLNYFGTDGKYHAVPRAEGGLLRDPRQPLDGGRPDGPGWLPRDRDGGRLRRVRVTLQRGRELHAGELLGPCKKEVSRHRVLLSGEGRRGRRTARRAVRRRARGGGGTGPGSIARTPARGAIARDRRPHPSVGPGDGVAPDSLRQARLS